MEKKCDISPTETNKQRTPCYAYTTYLIFGYFWQFAILTDHRLTFQPQNGVWSETWERGIFKTFIFNDSIYEAWGLGLKKGLFSQDFFNSKTDFWKEDLVSLMIKLWDLEGLIMRKNANT